NVALPSFLLRPPSHHFCAGPAPAQAWAGIQRARTARPHPHFAPPDPSARNHVGPLPLTRPSFLDACLRGMTVVVGGGMGLSFCRASGSSRGSVIIGKIGGFSNP